MLIQTDHDSPSTNRYLRDRHTHSKLKEGPDGHVSPVLPLPVQVSPQ